MSTTTVFILCLLSILLLTLIIILLCILSYIATIKKDQSACTTPSPPPPPQKDNLKNQLETCLNDIYEKQDILYDMISAPSFLERLKSNLTGIINSDSVCKTENQNTDLINFCLFILSKLENVNPQFAPLVFFVNLVLFFGIPPFVYGQYKFPGYAALSEECLSMAFQGIPKISELSNVKCHTNQYFFLIEHCFLLALQSKEQFIKCLHSLPQKLFFDGTTPLTNN